jgi:CHAD domain-containing protein
MQKTIEREAKFDIEAGAAVDLSRLPAGLVVVEQPEIRLSARYFDTAHLDLLQRGITLRHRRDLSGTGEDLWTVKLPDGAATAAVLARTEVSWPGTEVDVPTEARRLLTAVLQDRELRPVAAFVTVRRRREVRDGTGRRLAEVDDDRVTVTAPIGKVFRQIEVELDGGDADLIGRLSKLLRRSGANVSRSGEKLRLALADRIAEMEVGAPAPAAAPATLGQLFQARTVRSLDQLVSHDLGLRLDGHPENVHQARVACRRLRADIKTFAPILDPTWVEETTEELRWWGNVLGEVRDLDVLDLRLAGHAGGADDRDADGFASIATAISARRAPAWVRLRGGLEGDRYLRLLIRLQTATVTPPLAAAATGSEIGPGDDAGAGLGAVVRRPWRRLRHTVRRLPAEPSDVELHRVRIRAKQLRYSAESAASVIGAPAERLARAAANLQTELGDHHDAVVAEETIRSLVPSLDRSGAFVAGRCVAIEREAALAQRHAWPAAWRVVKDKKQRAWLR